MNVRALAAEAIGTFILLAFGFLGVATLGIATEGGGNPLVAILVIPFSFGLGLMAAIAVGGHASGGHYNPAVTLAALFDGRVTWQSAIGYVVAQVLGGLAATLSVLLLTSASVIDGAVNGPGPTAETVFAQELHAFSTEALLTAVFVAVILTITTKQPTFAVIVIPLTLVAIHYVGMLISGASVNPVRSLAPAVVSGNYTSLWVYLTGPFVGSVLGWGIFRFLTPDEEEVSIEIEEELDDDELEDLLEAGEEE
jgi:MIP family channel proteins